MPSSGVGDQGHAVPDPHPRHPARSKGIVDSRETWKIISGGLFFLRLHPAVPAPAAGNFSGVKSKTNGNQSPVNFCSFIVVLLCRQKTKMVFWWWSHAGTVPCSCFARCGHNKP